MIIFRLTKKSDDDFLYSEIQLLGNLRWYQTEKRHGGGRTRMSCQLQIYTCNCNTLLPGSLSHVLIAGERGGF